MTHFEDEFIFIWKVEHFSKLPHQKREHLESRTFLVETLDKNKWCLWLYPKGHAKDESDSYLSLFLVRVDTGTNETTLKMNYCLTIESLDSELEKSWPVRSCNVDAKGKGFAQFLALNLVYDKKNMYLPQDVLTIRCNILLLKEIGKDSAININSSALSNYLEKRCFATTRIEAQRRSLSWSITKTSKLEDSREKYSIHLVNSLEDSPDLKILFYIDKVINDEYVQIEILQTRSPRTKERLFVNCQITVVTVEKEYQVSYVDSHLFSSDPNEIWPFPDFILIDRLTEGKYTYVDDTMFLLCEFTFSRKGSEYHMELPMHVPHAFHGKQAPELTQLSNNIGELFVTKQFCDVKIRAGERTFLCHKVVLCAQSLVFRAMFENDMKERKTGVVEVKDVDPQTLERIVKFLYLEVIEDGLSAEEICKLYSAADMYAILTLQRRCSLLLLSTLSVKSVCDVLVIADNHQDNFLRVHVDTFMSIHSREVFHSPQWKTFMDDYPALWKKTMIKICME